MRNFTVVIIVWLSFLLTASASLNVVPTTTLGARTSNNTSASSSFPTGNGNLAAGNISKVGIRSLLYPGATTKIYAHLMVWFGGSNHMNVGYSSTDPAQVHRQITDMISRGIDGVIVDWYGPGNNEDAATKLVMKEAEAHPGFTFAIMVDKGAIPWSGCPGCSAQQTLIRELGYIAQTYFPSPAYMRQNGQPVVTNFDLDLHYSLNWDTIRAAATGNPAFIFQHSSGFTHAFTDGSYSWVILASDFGMSYLGSFYQTGLAHPAEQAFGAAYKGFNDSLAAWGAKRVMGQQCGKTWLQTFAKIRSFYNSGNQLDALQLVTWNDYEEGTEIESGIDNCLTISASLSGTALQWQVTGNESTVDHYNVFVSKDGRNLMRLAAVASGNHSVNLASFDLSAATYKLYVQAVGRPAFRNHMSGGVTFTVAPTAGSAPSIALGATPSALTVNHGASTKVQVLVSATSGTVTTPVSLSCANLPPGVSCTFSPRSVNPGSHSAASTMTISAATTLASRHQDPLNGLWFSAFGLAGLVLVNGKRLRKAGITLFATLSILALCACTGLGPNSTRSAASQTQADGAYTVAIQGISGSIHNSTTVSLRVQ